VKLVFFDCRVAVPNSADLIRIERAVERSIAAPPAYDEAQATLSLAAKRLLTTVPRSNV
jgi:hypothetical protein